MHKNFLVCCVAGLTSISASKAQETSAVEVDETLIVYGVRLEQPETEVGSSVSIVTADDIEALNLDFAVDAIAMAPGVTINQNGAFGGQASVRIRGASSEQTLVIIDDMIVNDPTSPGGGFNFARLDTASIDRIEVLKGPQSTLWGTDAIGGVVNVVTKRSSDALAGHVFLEAGSFQSLRGGVVVGGANGSFDYRLAITSNTADGISKADEANGNTETDGFDSTTVSARGGVELPANARLQATVMWTDAASDFDSFVLGEQGNASDGDERSTTDELNANIKMELPLFDGRLENTFLLGYAEIDRNNFTDGLRSFSSNGDRATYRYQGTLAINGSNQLAFGTERENLESNGEETSIGGLFTFYELKPLDTLTLTAGLRRDDHERYSPKTTGRFAVAYNPNGQVTLHGSWGQGFKAPTLFQTIFFCCGATEPNPDLAPESSEALDAGVTVRTADARGELDLTYFYQDTENLINFLFAVGGYENIENVKSSGIELRGQYLFAEWIELSLSYGYIDVEDGAGNTMPMIPTHSGDVELRFNPDGRYTGALLVRYNGEEQDPNGVVDSWTRVDLSGRYVVTDSVELYARIENLFDEQYQQVLGYGTPGLSGFVGARLSF